MASKTCASCLRTFQRQARSIHPTRRAASQFTSRTFTTTSARYVTLPEPNQPTSTSIPPISPAVGEGGPSTPSTPTPTALKAAAELRKIAVKSTETYTAYGATEVLYKECARQADYTIPQAKSGEEEVPKTEDGEDLGVGDGWWVNELGLKPTFSTWSQVTMLHMYLLSTRFRNFEPYIAQPWQQHLLDHFFYDAENRMTINHNMYARGTRNKYLKDLFIQWRGLLAAYDEGLVKGDAVLASAIWRNVFKANEDVDVKGLATIVSYMRRALKGLESLPDQKVMEAALQFGNPMEEVKAVAQKSQMMDLPFEKAPGEDLSASKQG